MELIKELLDEANEEILKKLDETIGLAENKQTLRDIVRYHKAIKECNCNVEFENYNIVIRNKSYYHLYEELISIISEIYYKNGIVQNQKVLYMDREELRARKTKNENEKSFEEGIIVINLESSRMDATEIRKTIEKMTEDMQGKAFIILENSYSEGETNAILNDYFLWSMKIEQISDEEKKRYIKKFMDTNKLEVSQKIIDELADNPYYKIKNNLTNILVNCKINKETNVAKVLKKEDKLEENKKKEKQAMEELESLTGLEEVKEQIKKVINFIKLSKNRNNMPMLHMCFNGNPGTGKTTVARIVGKIFAEENILSNKEVFVEAQRNDLIGKYVGHTAPKTQDVINKALGGVLFIDEAYSIASYIQDEGGRDYGAECIATLLKGMEDNRNDLCVILAGYTEEMNHMLNVNPGFESRIQFTINFPDYNAEELYTIFKNLCKSEKYKLSSNIKHELIKHFEIAKNAKNFSNARYVRSLFEKMKIEQANRVLINKEEDINTIKKCDIETVLKKMEPLENNNKIKIGFAS